MDELPIGGSVTAAELGGDFVLPKDPREPLLFVAGGIGITPFRGMLKLLSDTGDRRDIVLLYAAATEDDSDFRDVIGEASCSVGLKAVYVLSGRHAVPPGRRGRAGRVDAGMIGGEVTRPGDRTRFVSGSPGMGDSVTRSLRSLGVPRRRIHTDFFPGYGPRG